MDQWLPIATNNQWLLPVYTRLLALLVVLPTGGLSGLNIPSELLSAVSSQLTVLLECYLSNLCNLIGGLFGELKTCLYVNIAGGVY